MKKGICRKGHDLNLVGQYGSGCALCGKANAKEYRKKNRELILDYRYRYKFGISLEEYNRMFQKQNGLCLGCYKHQSSIKRAFAVDHNHLTGKIRGLLCANCNVTLGNAQDNPVILRRLADYLESHKEI